ncbi:hypothetical protein [Streptomyces sp. NPDC051577]|uniref:hypothetical protein n=1 Tax=Streptomyces sp. NPDC051577 TaxID=3155166 RepID=UPI0034483190
MRIWSQRGAASDGEGDAVELGVRAGDFEGAGPFDQVSSGGASEVAVEDPDLVELAGGVGLRAPLVGGGAAVFAAAVADDHDVVGVPVELGGFVAGRRRCGVFELCRGAGGGAGWKVAHGSFSWS